MNTIGYAAFALVGYLLVQLHRLASGCASIARYAAMRAVDLAIELARLACLVALACAIWFLIDPASATTRLAALKLWAFA